MASKKKIYEVVLEVLEDELPEYAGEPLLENIADEVTSRVCEEVEVDDDLEEVEDEEDDEILYEDDEEDVRDSDEE